MVGRLKMGWYGIMDQCADAPLTQVLLELISFIGSDHEEMINMRGTVYRFREGEIPNI